MRQLLAIGLVLVVTSCGGEAPTSGTDPEDHTGAVDEGPYPIELAWDGNYIGVVERVEYGFGDVLKQVPPQIGENGLLSIDVTPDPTAADTTRAPRHVANGNLRASRDDDAPFVDHDFQYGPSPSVRSDRMGDSSTGMNISSGGWVWKWNGAVVYGYNDTVHLNDTSDQDYRRRYYNDERTRFIGFPEQEVDASKGWAGSYGGYVYRDSTELYVTIASVSDSLEVTVQSESREIRLRVDNTPGSASCLAGAKVVLVPASGDTTLAFAAVLAGDRLGILASHHESYVVNTFTGGTGGMVPIWSVTGVLERQ